MADPITWQNLIAPAPQRDAYNPMVAAAISMNAGMENLRGAYNQYDKQRSEDNTSAFQAALGQYKTPEELQAAQASGAIDALRAQYGVQMDQKIAQNGAQDRINALTKAAMDANTYTDQTTERTQRPLVEQYGLLLAQNKRDEAAALLAANPSLAHQDKLAQAAADAGYAATARSQQQQTFDNTQKTFRTGQITADLNQQEIARRLANAAANDPVKDAQRAVDLAAIPGKANLNTAQVGVDTETARNNEAKVKREAILRTATEEHAAAAQKIAAYITANPNDRAGAIDLTDKLLNSTITRHGLTGTEADALVKENSSILSAGGRNADQQVEFDNSKALNNAAALAIATNNPTVRHSINPKGSTELIDSSINTMFSNKTDKEKDAIKAAVANLVGTTIDAKDPTLIKDVKTGKMVPSGKPIKITVTPEDALRIVNRSRDDGWFGEGSITNLDPWKFKGNNRLHQDLLTPERIAQEVEGLNFVNTKNRTNLDAINAVRAPNNK